MVMKAFHERTCWFVCRLSCHTGEGPLATQSNWNVLALISTSEWFTSFPLSWAAIFDCLHAVFIGWGNGIVCFLKWSSPAWHFNDLIDTVVLSAYLLHRPPIVNVMPWVVNASLYPHLHSKDWRMCSSWHPLSRAGGCTEPQLPFCPN